MSSNPLYPCLIEKIRSSDTTKGVIAGEFLLKEKTDFVIAKNDTLEFYRYDPSYFTFQPYASYCLFAHIHSLSSFNIRDPNANVFDDLQEEYDFQTLPFDVNQFKLRLEDKSIPLLEKFGWQGSDLILLTSSRGFLDVFAVAIHPILNEPVFLHLKEILIQKKQFIEDYRELGPYLTIHPKSHDIAIAAIQDTIEVWSATSTSFFYLDQPNHHEQEEKKEEEEESVIQCKTYSPMMMIWHLFFLQPHPCLDTNYLIAIGYRDVTKQAVITLFEKKEHDTITHSLPFDLFSYPSLLLAFPLPFSFDTFCIVTELYLIACKVPDIMNGNTSLKRISLPDIGGKLSGYCTIPDRVSEYFYLLSESGTLLKANLKQVPVQLQGLNVLDGNLVYITKQTIHDKVVDVLLAYSDHSDWFVLLVGSKFFHQVMVHSTLTPISHAVALKDTSLLLAGNNQLIHVQEKKPFYIQSKSDAEFDDAIDLFPSGSFLLVSFTFQSRLLHLKGNDMVDITHETQLMSNASTLWFSMVGSKYYQITATSIFVYNEQFELIQEWHASESSSLTLAMTCSHSQVEGVLVVLLLPMDTFQLCFFSFQLDLVQSSSPFTSTPTCMTCTSTHIYVGTYDATVLMFPFSLNNMDIVTLPDLHIPHSLFIRPNQNDPNVIGIGCRNGVYRFNSTQFSRLGYGPVHLFSMGTQVFLLCDDQFFLYKEMGPIPINLSCRLVAPYMNGFICIQQATLIFGQLGTGLSIQKFSDFPKPPRRLLVTDQCIFVICTAQQSSDIVILDRQFQKKSALPFEEMVISSLSFGSPFKTPKLILGTAIFKHGKEIGGKVHVFRFQKNSVYDLDSENMWSSTMFSSPIRSMTKFGKLAFVISTGSELRRLCFDLISHSITGHSPSSLPSFVTCLLANEETQLLAVGTLRDSVTLLRFSDPHWERLACDGFARSIMDMRWWNEDLLVCDREGTLVVLRYDPDMESGTLQNLLVFHTGFPLIQCLPTIPSNAFLCLSVSGALFLFRPQFKQGPILTKEFLTAFNVHTMDQWVYRQVHGLGTSVLPFIEFEKLIQDPLKLDTRVPQLSRKL